VNLSLSNGSREERVLSIVACVILEFDESRGQLSLFNNMWAIGVPEPSMVHCERSVPVSKLIPSSFMFLRIWRERLSLIDALVNTFAGVFNIFSGRQSLF